MSTVAAALDRARRALAAAGIEDAPREARLLLAHAMGENEARLVGWPEREVEAAADARFAALVARRARREPVAYLLGVREFWGLSFRVTPATLIPRPDTETLVEAVLAHAASRDRALRILDIGTGSGCILLSLLHELPRAIGTGVEPSTEALAVAQDNARRLGLADRARWTAALPEGEAFDVVTANLPYIPTRDLSGLEPDVRDYEPRTALDGGDDGLDVIRTVAAALPRLLVPGGLALFEAGFDQASDVERIFAGIAGLAPAGRWRDLAGIERVTGARRVDG